MREPADLFGLADDLAELLGCPVTIENPDTVVVAYAGDHRHVDEARVETILNRRVPARYRVLLEQAGAFERLRSTGEVFAVNLPELGSSHRAVVGLHTEHELVGSIWAVMQDPPTDDQRATLQMAAPVAATLLSAARRSADQAARERTAQLERLLSGGEPAVAVAARTGFTDHVAVVALHASAPGAATRIAGALTLSLTAVTTRFACGAQGENVYCVVDAGSARRLVTDFLTRTPGAQSVVAGIGETVAAAALPRSRELADEIAAVLARRGSVGLAAELHDVYADVLVDRLRGFLDTYAAMSPLSRLESHDDCHDTLLVDAVDAYLHAAGNVVRAAESLHVHPNTIRNRLRRARETCGVDPDDPTVRLALMIHLAARR